MTALRRGDWWLIGVSAGLTVAAAVTSYTPSGNVVPFIAAGLALAVLAALVGRAVDGLGDRLGSGATGVVQSALGNIPELLFGIFALRKGLVTVVQATIVGSILSNVLLVLGMAFIVGGLRHGPQRFSAEGPRTISVLLMLSVGILIIPSITASLSLPAAAHERVLSDVASVVLLVVFALSIPAALRRAEPAKPGEGQASAPDGPPADGPPHADGPPPDQGHEGGARWPLWLAIGMLAVAGVAAALVSDWFANSLTPALTTLHISPAFAGLVIVAIAGNAVENFVGIQLAARNRMDYALSVTLQSPVQIALGIAPLLVLISAGLGGAQLTLVFPPLMIVALALTVIITTMVVFDGIATWVEGSCLVGLYVVVAAAFWWG
jgi:Ca2+:H+ antiporter